MTDKQPTASLPLGTSDVRVSLLGIGTWAWGAPFFWGDYSVPDLQAAFDASLTGGVTFFDTAEMYGSGRSEELLGSFVKSTDQKPVIATKFMPFPWRLAKSNLLGALRASLKRLGVQQVDLYQIHWPFPPRSIDTWVSALGDAIEAGLTKLVGVSNYSASQTRRAHAVLAERGYHLTSNQVQYSLLARGPERNGLLDTCHELGVTLIAYSPLAQGILTGKYTPDNPPPGMRGRRYSREYLRRAQPVVGLLREIGQAHGGKSATQTAINWTICKGTLPIPGARNVRQAQEIVGAMGWNLTADEVAALDRAADTRA